MLIVNEEGKIKKLPINEKATEIFIDAHGLVDIIVGDVVLADTKEIR
jgi:hypothetical protein